MNRLRPRLSRRAGAAPATGSETTSDRRLRERIATILAACGIAPAHDLSGTQAQLVRLLETADPRRMWLARSVIGADLPDDTEMLRLLRVCRLSGPLAALAETVATIESQDPGVRVRVDVGETTCDVHNTSSTDYTSGIQRVVRAVAVRWARDHDVRLLAWDEPSGTMQTLSAEQHQRMVGAGQESCSEREVVVPWQGVHLVPELFAERYRCERILALAKYSGCRVGVIGYDCIPMTTASSVSPGMAAAFGDYLAACRHTDRLAAISVAAADEYLGWRAMLAGVREAGPDVAPIELPLVAQRPSGPALARARRRLGVTQAPMVLVVGSHEPRKNHLAVLHAAESLWREGLHFTLVIAGAGSWRAERYHALVEELTAAGRPLLSVAGLPDELLWAAYRLAHCTLFPSLNEGFGLPVAESLAAGTPVITSDFGSTCAIVAPSGEPWGGLLVDPHDDDDIAAALRRMLTEPETHRRLTAECSRHEPGSWDDYAERVWDYLTG